MPSDAVESGPCAALELSDATSRPALGRGVGECAVGQRHEAGVLDRDMDGVVDVWVYQGVADDDRAALVGAEQVGDVGIVSAAGLGGGGLGGDAGLVDRRRACR